jgi:uncharacterized protein (DUF2062 family)
MILAAIGAIVARVNLPISVVLVWITNPLTMPPIFYFAYKVGTWILDRPVQEIHFELSGDWLMQELGHIWQPFLLGCFICGVISAVLGYVFMRGFWRLHVSRSWQHRRQKREHARLEKSE